ncbi:hypothetical protein BKA62DRAFT_249088 [Auriculariales sp. MPI-PUGE-AT-0066]|nr:hypothetical protein BKA62DRAFT_249088 [Auriculariales sp. MPI-PUGE-AT-0066]
MVLIAKSDEEARSVRRSPSMESDRSLPPAYAPTVPFEMSENMGMMERSSRPILISNMVSNIRYPAMPPVSPVSPVSFEPVIAIPTPKQRRRRSLRASFRFIALAFVVLLVLASGGLLTMSSRTAQVLSSLLPYQAPSTSFEPTLPTEVDGRIVHQFNSSSNAWTRDSLGSHALRARLEFSLQLNESMGYFFTVKGPSYGSIAFHEVSAGDEIRVTAQVTSHLRDHDSSQSTNAFVLARGVDELGVGIYMPQFTHGSRLELEIDVYVPAASVGPRWLRSLDVDTPDLRQDFSFGDGVAVGQLKLNANTIDSETRFNTDTVIAHAQSSIRGMFAAKNDMSLTVESGPVFVEAALGRGIMPRESDAIPTLTLQGSLVRVGGIISLLDATHFKIRVYALHGSELSYTIDSMPANAVLDLETSSRSHTDVRLPPTYEGTLDLCTPQGSSPVRIAEGLRDPEGQDRQLMLQDTGVEAGKWKGSVGWGDLRRRHGSVVMHYEASEPRVDLSRHRCRLSIS